MYDDRCIKVTQKPVILWAKCDPVYGQLIKSAKPRVDGSCIRQEPSFLMKWTFMSS